MIMPLYLIGFSSLLLMFTSCTSDLASESVSEGPCISNITSYLSKNLSPIFFAAPRKYYMPIASEGCYRNYAEVFLGRSASSEEELDKLNIRIAIRTQLRPVPGQMWKSRGFNDQKFFQQYCSPNNQHMSQLVCRPVPGFFITSPGTNTSKISTSVNSIVYTDNQSALLIVRCLNDNVRDYQVLTVNPTVSHEVQELITQKIVEMGFNETLITFKNYYV